MDSFDPFAGFATEMKASLPNGGIANGKAPSADEVSGGPQKIVPAAKANAPMPGGGNGGAYQRSPAANPSQQPMMKGMPMMVMGGSGSGSAQESQHMFQQRNAPMPSFSSPNPTFQQPQPPMQWGPNNNSFQPQQQNFSTQQSSPAKYPHTQQNPAHSHLQSPLAPNQAPPKLLGVQPAQQQPVQPQFAQQQNTQQQLAQQQPTQKQPTQKQPTQQQPTQQQPIQRPTKMQFTQQNVQPYPQQQSWQQPLPPQKQNEQEEEQDAIFCRIPSIVHAKTGDEGDVKDLRRTNSDDVSQLNDDVSSFCPPPPPSVAPPPPPPSNEQAALEGVVPSTEQPTPTQSNDVDIFGGLFDYPASPPFTPYDIENVKSMDSSPDGILASNPSIDDDYLFSDDDDDDDFFGIFGGDSNNKALTVTNNKASDLSTSLGITKRTEESDQGLETEGEKLKDNTRAAESSQKNKLPPGGEFYDCKVYTSTLGVMFFAPFELTDSLFRDMDRSSVVEVLDQRPVVAHILEQGAAKSVGVQVGHVLLQVNGKEVKTPQEANLAIRESSRPMKLLFYVLKEPINVAEGQYMVKYDTRDTGAPPTSRDWKPKYVVVGGIIAHSHMLNMYRSKAEYDVAVMDTQARRPVSVKVKQFTLKGARLWNEVGKENGISKPHVRKVKYRSQMKPWNYIVILPLKRDPIKISVPGSSTENDNGLQQLKIVHEGIRQFIHGPNSNNAVATASATATQP